MKTLKFFGSTVLICLFVVACAKTKKEEEARISGPDKGKVEGDTNADGGNSRDGNRTKPKFDITKEGYTSKMLVLEKRVEGKTDNKGKIEVDGKDAMELWERMRVKATAADDVGQADRIETDRKDGKSVSCFEYTPTNQKENTPKYTCVIEFNHSTGKVGQSRDITIDEQTIEKETSYKGTNLTITPSKNDSAALLSLYNDDAKALFDSLAGDAKPMIDSKGKDLNDKFNDTMVKNGENIRCYETKNPMKDLAPTYTCSLSINANDGTVKTSDTSTAAATPADEGTKAEDGDQGSDPAAAPESSPAPQDPATSLSSVKASQK